MIKLSKNWKQKFLQMPLDNINTLKNSIVDWNEEELTRQKNLFANVKEQLKVKLQEQNVKNNKEWLSQTEEQFLEMGLKIKEIENKLSELPNN